jgi:hypothetical protein
MEFIRTSGKKIVNESGGEVYLRGTCVGGWMNLEDFINFYPGTASTLKQRMKEEIGEKLSDYFFKRMADYFLTEKDISYIASLGANCLRLPLNYREFEDDDAPFKYKQSAFERLDGVLKHCGKYGIYAILDLHAAQGWQNCHWHSDNERGACLLWFHPHFQERVARLWEAIAERYSENAAVAGYELLNEPSTGNPNGEHSFDFYKNFKPDWARINRLYKEVTTLIRKHDKKHMIFLEGDNYARIFSGLEAPFDDNLVYSSHNYYSPGFGAGIYPGHYASPDGLVFWDKNKYKLELETQEGTIFCRKHNVPLFIGEFGSQYHGDASDVPYRLRAMKDHLDACCEAGAHWTTWTYKDAGIMGIATLDPASEYCNILEPVQAKKRELGAENFVAQYWRSPGREKARELSDIIHEAAMIPTLNPADTAYTFNYAALTGFAAAMLQGAYAKRFAGMDEKGIDRVLSAFAFENCVINEEYARILSSALKGAQ